MTPEEAKAWDAKAMKISPAYSEDITKRFFALIGRMLEAGMCAACASGAAIERAEKAMGRDYTAEVIPCRQRERKRPCAAILADMRSTPDLDRREAPKPPHTGPLPPHRQQPAVKVPPKTEQPQKKDAA